MPHLSDPEVGIRFAGILGAKEIHAPPTGSHESAHGAVLALADVVRTTLSGWIPPTALPDPDILMANLSALGIADGRTRLVDAEWPQGLNGYPNYHLNVDCELIGFQRASDDNYAVSKAEIEAFTSRLLTPAYSLCRAAAVCLAVRQFYSSETYTLVSTAKSLHASVRIEGGIALRHAEQLLISRRDRRRAGQGLATKIMRRCNRRLIDAGHDEPPSEPVAEFCLVPPQTIRWRKAVPVEPRLWHLLGLVFDYGDEPVPFENIAVEILNSSRRKDKTIQNMIYELNKALGQAGFPWGVRTKSGYLCRNPEGP